MSLGGNETATILLTIGIPVTTLSSQATGGLADRGSFLTRSSIVPMAVTSSFIVAATPTTGEQPGGVTGHITVTRDVRGIRDETDQEDRDDQGAAATRFEGYHEGNNEQKFRDRRYRVNPDYLTNARIQLTKNDAISKDHLTSDQLISGHPKPRHHEISVVASPEDSLLEMLSDMSDDEINRSINNPSISASNQASNFDFNLAANSANARQGLITHLDNEPLSISPRGSRQKRHFVREHTQTRTFYIN